MPAKPKEASPIQVQRYLKGLQYPASKEDIIQRIKDSDAPNEVIEFMQRLPDQEYKSPIDISRAVGQLT
ncbi:MAG: DUF2795 domain-containing protein [Anaerolineae bacterium]|jgi:hypothetical protein